MITMQIPVHSLLTEKTTLTRLSERVDTLEGDSVEAGCAENMHCEHSHHGDADQSCENAACDSMDGSAIPEVDAALPRQTKVRAWEGSLDASSRPDREDLPAPP